MIEIYGRQTINEVYKLKEKPQVKWKTLEINYSPDRWYKFINLSFLNLLGENFFGINGQFLF